LVDATNNLNFIILEFKFQLKKLLMILTQHLFFFFRQRTSSFQIK